MWKTACYSTLLLSQAKSLVIKQSPRVSHLSRPIVRSVPESSNNNNNKYTYSSTRLLSSSSSSSSSSTTDDVWKETAQVYSDQASRLTQLHGSDLITILRNDIMNAKTILDVGAGAGAFAHAYLQHFPTGIPGQTLILSDLSEGMLEQAKKTLKIPSDYQTKIIFQIEDGTRLEGIETDSMDMVVSTFGVFLIPDQEATLASIQRVMKPEAVFGNASWIWEGSSKLASMGFGVTLQEAFTKPVDTINPSHSEEAIGPLKKWSDADEVERMLTADYKFDSVKMYRALHSTVWEYDNLWGMIENNPMTNMKDLSPEDEERAKSAFQKFVTQDGAYSTDEPLMISSASNLAVARGLPA
ncbi:unnamed protein product [Cylindrotheca closterium]|uniref:Methyltransferase domain-containing protein n=1 Tax=Cylindrotheca closterium TaxID=2856 RepID=A0AAD2CCP2_9STRA|nr:unnamed protein product [Cylindrotheca closterium]